MNIYCCGCGFEVKARLTSGKEVYSHRKDLANLPFWICRDCKNFVGCHYKTKNRTNPLGVIATKEIKQARIKIHDLIDPMWKPSKKKRREIYNKISDAIGYKYHTANIKSIEEARRVYRAALKLKTLER